MNRLITIRFSHYNERARWALDRARIAYQEEPHLPLFHMPAVFFATGLGNKDRVSSPMSTPVLIRSNGEVLRDSGDILRFSLKHSGEDLYPSDEVRSLERRFHDRLGPHTRRLTYHHILPMHDLMRELARNNVGGFEAGLFSLGLPVFVLVLRKLLNINPHTTAKSLRIVKEEFEFVSDLLKDRDYLCGDEFSAADLTFASLSAAILIPGAGEGYGAMFCSRERFPKVYRDLVDELRATPAGQHALRMFAEERGTRLFDCEPPLDLDQVW